jgi:hypothetical protein
VIDWLFDWLIDWTNAKYASLGTSKSIAMCYYHHENAKYGSLGTSKTSIDFWLIDWTNAKYGSSKSKSIAICYYHHENAKYATLGTSETTKAPQNFTENSPYASLHMGTSKTLKYAGPILDSDHSQELKMRSVWRGKTVGGGGID